MPERDPSITGSPCWADLATTDVVASSAFYSALFGWESVDSGPDYGGYVNFVHDGQSVVGCMGMDAQAGPSNVWTVYLTTDDIAATAAAAAANGGQMLMPPMEVRELGSMAIISDAGQAAIGAWQPGEHRGFTTVGEPGAPSWFELHTRDYDASVRFYQEVFGWDAHVAVDEPGFRYTTLGEGEAQAAGIMDAGAFLPEGVPAHWSIYFQVADVDASLARTVELGGSVVMGAEDTPYGRLATAADSTGALFKLRG